MRSDCCKTQLSHGAKPFDDCVSWFEVDVEGRTGLRFLSPEELGSLTCLAKWKIGLEAGGPNQAIELPVRRFECLRSLDDVMVGWLSVKCQSQLLGAC
jgi:hypothetical protein